MSSAKMQIKVSKDKGVEGEAYRSARWRAGGGGLEAAYSKKKKQDQQFTI